MEPQTISPAEQLAWAIQNYERVLGLYSQLKGELALARSALKASGEYILALRQAVYSRDPKYQGKEHFELLDRLSQAEWPLREAVLTEEKTSDELRKRGKDD